jgi:SynChlorMet cassette radical SAM/SPASM protein ScmF
LLNRDIQTIEHKPSAPGVPPLGELYFYLTEGCNLACRHCWLAPAFDGDGSKHAMLPVALFRDLLDEARPLGLRKVKLTGGEPLLHPHFLELLDVTRAAGLGVTVETNGLLCTPEITAAIAAIKNPFVAVSLDGVDAETHEWVRGVKGAFDKATAAIRRLAEAGIRPQIIMTVMRRNAGQIEPMVRLAEDLGAASLKFNVVQPTARGDQLRSQGETLGIGELIALGRHVDNELAATTKLRLLFDYPMAFRPLRRIARHDSICGILNILGVLSTGHFALCGIGMQVPELVFGTAGKDSLKEVWHDNPVLNKIRSGMPGQFKGICSRCLMLQRCLGACLAQNYYGTRDLWAPFWFCRMAEEEGLFPVSRLNLKRRDRNIGETQ